MSTSSCLTLFEVGAGPFALAPRFLPIPMPQLGGWFSLVHTETLFTVTLVIWTTWEEGVAQVPTKDVPLHQVCGGSAVFEVKSRLHMSSKLLRQRAPMLSSTSPLGTKLAGKRALPHAFDVARSWLFEPVRAGW